MCRLSSRSSLLAVVSAVVLAASVGSGAFAQTAVQTAVEYTYSEAFDTWANGEERTGPSSDIRAAREGDHLTLTKGTVILRHNSRSKRIGVLRSGTSGSGRLILQLLGRFSPDLTGRIGEIKKQGPQAVDLFVWNAAGEKRVAEFIVARDAVVNNLSIDATPEASYSISSSRARVVFGGDLTIEDGAILNDGGANNRAYLVFNGSANQRISGTAQITAAADGEGTIQVLNGVNNRKSKTATFDIGIGANDKRLRQLTVGDSDKGGDAIFNRGVHVDRIDVIAGDHRDEKVLVEFRGDVSGDAMRLDDNGAGKAVVIFGALGGDKTVGLTIDGASAGEGYLRIYGGDAGGSNTITFTGGIGRTGNLRIVSVGDGGSFAVFKEDVNSDFFRVTGGDAAGEASQATVEKNLTAGVTLADNAGSATLIIGGAGRLATVNDTGQLLSGSIVGDGDGQGTLIVDNRGDAGAGRTNNNRVTFSDSVGSDGTALQQIMLSDGRTAFFRGVYARSITINTTDATVFRGDVKAETGIKLGDGSSVTFGDAAGTDAAGQTITGNVTSAAGGNYGTIIIGNTHADGVTFKGNLGASGDNNGLSRVTLNTNARAAFGGNVYLENGLTFANGSQVTFNGTGSQTVAGDLTSAAGGDYGTIIIANTHADGVSFTGSLGASGANNGLSRVTLNTNARATFGGNVYLATGLTLGQNTRVTLNGSGDQQISAKITNGSRVGYGDIVVNNTGGTVTFARVVGGGGGLLNITLDNGQTVFDGAVYAGTIDVNADSDGTIFNSFVATSAGLTLAGAATFKGSVAIGWVLAFDGAGGSATFDGTTGQRVMGDITSAAGGNYGGIIIDNDDGVTFKGALGTNSAKLNSLTLSDDSEATFEGNVYLASGLTLGKSTITFGGSGNQTIQADIRNSTGKRGSVFVDNTGTTHKTVSFEDAVGATGNDLAIVIVSDGVAVFKGDVFAQGVGVVSTDGAEFKSNVTAGALGILFAVNDDAKITLNGVVNQTVTGDITADYDGRGLLVVDNAGTTNNTVTFVSQIGSDVTALKQITLDNGQTVFAGAVYAGTIDVNADSDGTTFNSSVTTGAGLTLAGAATFKGSVTTGANGLVFDGAGGSATFAGAQTITPAITTTQDNQGAITIANRAGVTFEGNLGTTNARLAGLTLHRGTKATLEQSGYFAGNVTLRNTATLIVGDASDVTGTNGRGTGATDAQTITGNIVAGDDGQGNLEIRNRSGHATGRKVSFTGSIGADDRALNRITVAEGETTFNGDVYAGNLTITARDATTFRGNVKADREFELGKGSSVTFGGTAGQRITGNITSASGGNYGTIIIANTHADGVTFGGQLGTSGHGLRSLTVNEGAKVTFTRPVYLSGTLRLKTGTTLVLGDYLTRRDDATQAFVTVGDYAFDGDFTEANRVKLILPLSFTSGTQKVFSAHDTLDKEKFSFAGNNLVNYSYDFDDDGTDVTVKEKGSDVGDEGNQGDGSGGDDTDVKVADKDADAGDEGNQGDGSGDTDVKVADKDADKDAGDEGNQGDGSGDTDVKVADKDADKDAGDEGNQGDGSGDTDVKVADKDADKDAGDEGNQGDGSGDTDVKVADKDADKDAGDEGNQGDGSGDTDVKVADKDADKDAGDEGNQGDGSGDTDVKVADKDADKDAGDEGNQGDGSGDTDVKVADKDADAGDEGNQGDGSGDTDVKVADKDAGDEGNQGDGSGDTDVKVADKDADKDAGDEGNQGDGSGDTDVKVADKDADAGDEGNQGDGSGDTDVKVADKDADKDAGDEGNQGDGSGDTDVKVADKDADKDAGDEGNQGDGSGDTDVKVADKDADKDAGDEGNQGDGSGDTDVKVADKDADKDAGDEGNQGDGSGDTDVKVADKDADAGDEGNQGDGSGDTDVKVADKDAGDEGNQGDGSGDTDVKVADKDADKDAGDEGNQGDGSGDTDVKVADKDADKDAGDEGNQGDGSGDTDVKVADKDADAGDEGNQGDGSGDTDVKVADKDADKDAGDEGNQGDGSGDTDVKVADKDADKDAGDEGNQGDGSGDTDVKVADKDADKDAGDEGNQGDGSGDTDVKVADKDADAGDEGNQGDGSGDTDVKVADKDADAGDEGNQGDGSGDTDVKVADKDADKDAGDEGNQGDGSGDTDVKVADKDADKDAGDEGNQGDGSGDTDVKVADKDADKDAGDEGNQGDGSGDTDVKVADKDADKDAGDEGNQGDGSGDTDVKVADKDADKDAGDEGNQGDGSGDTDVKEVAGKDKDADRDVPLNLKSGGDGSGSDDTDVKDVDDKDADRDVDVADKGLSRPIALMTPNAVGFKSAGEVSSKLGVSLSEATVLLAAADVAKDLPANDPVKKILEEATRAGNEAQVRRLAAQLTPQMTALVGVRRAVLSTGRQVAGLLSDRLALQRGGDSQSGFVQSGFATGGEGLDRAFWLKPFGSRGEQAKDRKRAIDGYRTSARGLAVGVDAPVGERGRVGTALAYSTSRITGKGFGEDKTDVRSWQVSIYGDYSTGRYYVDGQVGVGRNDVSTTSRVAGLRRKSAYDTTSLTASVGGGVPLRLDASTTLTPTAGLSWTRVGSARYTTTGALSLNQKITVGSIDAVVGTLGTRIQRDITRKHSNRTLVPVARVGLSYDFAGEQMTARGRFTGGGSRFTVKGAKVRKLSGTAGVGLSYSTPRWSIGADYDVSARPGYTGHSARLNAKVKF